MSHNCPIFFPIISCWLKEIVSNNFFVFTSGEFIIRPASFTDTNQKTGVNESSEIAARRFTGGTGKTLTFGIGNSGMAFHEGNDHHLSFIKSKFSQHGFCQPVSPEGDNELASALLEARFRKTGLLAIRDHIERPGTGLLDENHNLNCCLGCVIPMDNSIDKCFMDSRDRDLIAGITHRCFIPCRNAAIKF